MLTFQSKKFPLSSPKIKRSDCPTHFRLLESSIGNGKQNSETSFLSFKIYCEIFDDQL